VNFLPGPVTVRREVRRAFEQAPESHRGEDFKKDFQATKHILCDLVRAGKVELFMGSGTLANDVVAGQLSLLGQPGLVLSNGEFGSRLVDQARRFNLKFETLEFPWGQPLDLAAVKRKLSGNIAWLWCTHCETSTGILADLAALKILCAKNGTKLCLDCVSSIGTMLWI
jgi:aspartate aminotransferase-like enzyme